MADQIEALHVGPGDDGFVAAVATMSAAGSVIVN